ALLHELGGSRIRHLGHGLVPVLENPISERHPIGHKLLPTAFLDVGQRVPFSEIPHLVAELVQPDSGHSTHPNVLAGAGQDPARAKTPKHRRAHLTS
ncbi:MAG TPA: hypothetical protein VE623_22175, partial [Acidimicrobiales bacterium]|nr:hypothetical protein [Acidimicrobiales bacterium]